MYLLSIFLLIIVCIVYSIVASGGSIFYYLDPVSFILLVLLALPILISAGLLKDFNNAFRLSIKRQEHCSRTELLRAIESVTLAIKALLISGLFNSVFEIIHVTASMEGEMLIRCISVALVTLVYAIFLVILLLPLKSRLVVRLHELPETSAKSGTTQSESSPKENAH